MYRFRDCFQCLQLIEIIGMKKTVFIAYFTNTTRSGAGCPHNNERPQQATRDKAAEGSKPCLQNGLRYTNTVIGHMVFEGHQR